ncbi:MAG: hypothetical protein JSS40_07805 [Proteobacteria bacterium]|nr:hypothetical protein [Pseudomonadota bacterium]
MNHPLQCRCGTLKGYVSPPGMAVRMICYCRDCQAYARFLGTPGAVLDPQGGTEIVATLPGQVHFTEGEAVLACMSLSGRGPLRWYASCCNTPIGNTSRDFKTAYVGLVHSCLAGSEPSLQESFGPVRMVLWTKSANGEVKPSQLGVFAGMLRIMTGVIGARIGGAYKHNPFFLADTGTAIREPRVLTEAERDRFTNPV